jgi:hypothetical protein
VAAEEPTISALVAQLYVVTTVGVALVLATGREENRRLTTELRAAEAGAAYQARLLDGVVAAMDHGIVVDDEAGEVRFRNAAATSLPATGDAGRRLQAAVAQALAGEEVRGLELTVDIDGSDRVVEVSAVPLPRDERRGPAGCWCGAATRPVSTSSAPSCWPSPVWSRTTCATRSRPWRAGRT